MSFYAGSLINTTNTEGHETLTYGQVTYNGLDPQGFNININNKNNSNKNKTGINSMSKSRMSLLTITDTPSLSRGSSRFKSTKERSRQNGIPLPGVSMKAGLKLNKKQTTPPFYGMSLEQTPNLDPVEFPSLPIGKPGMLDVYPQNLLNSYRQQNPLEHVPFITKSVEDFPALPKASPGTIGNHLSGSRAGGKMGEKEVSRGIISYPDGRMTNIPSSMVADQFGMVGLISMIKLIETDRNLVALPCGYDLGEFGLDLESKVSLYPSFGGPFVNGSVRTEDVEVEVPREYNITNSMVYPEEVVNSVREKLTPLKIKNFKDDLLFHLFYSFAGDILQLLAASELFARDWRYHKEERVWIIRIPGVGAEEKGRGFEKGTYYFFDTNLWKKRDRQFVLEYEKLEERPIIPQGYFQKYLSYSTVT